ncbi:MAG: hypothetical protein LBL65_05450 [Campylobacteraceae bacterium]|jgi:hypothetical protein|nr:hypothetical protein [Campylobacteraceae bacterium]
MKIDQTSHIGTVNGFYGKTIKNLLAMVILFTVVTPCFSENCFDSSEYKNSSADFQASMSESAAQLEKIVDFLIMIKGLNFDQALKEVMDFSTPETIAYDKALDEIGKKIRPMDPQSPEECLELIKLQKQHRDIGKDKVHFIVNKITEQAGISNSTINTDASK